MPNRVSGSLLGVLRRSRTAWYRGTDGITAYYEQPSPGAPGVLVVNGRRVTGLVVDREGIYADFPAPQIQHMMIARGVDLERGWTCGQETHGMHINEALKKSRYSAVRHHNGRISIQIVSESHAIIFVNGIQRWRIRLADAERAAAEMGLVFYDGWYPVQTNLVRLSQ
jgi:hypothetical protein